MAYENIVYEVKEGIATITFNRPKALNSFREKDTALLRESLARLALDEGVGAVVLTGTGRYYSSGADFKDSFAQVGLQWPT